LGAKAWLKIALKGEKAALVQKGQSPKGISKESLFAKKGKGGTKKTGSMGENATQTVIGEGVGRKGVSLIWKAQIPRKGGVLRPEM